MIAAAVSTLLAGDVNGQVVITKRLTKAVIAPVNYSLRGAALEVGPRPAKTEFARMVILLEGGPVGTAEAPVSRELRQLSKQFDPELLVVPAGSTVSFPNSDPIFHNVFSLSKPKSFDLGYYPQGQTRKVTFPQPGIVQVYCHIHSTMYSVIVITKSSRHMQPSDDGTFSFRGVPAGTYEMIVWHNSSGLVRQRVEVKDGEPTPMMMVKVPYIYAEK
jgi:plastocyanin